MKEMNPKEMTIADFDYPLPDDRIALFPLEERDASKLLLYKEGNIEEHPFSALPEQLSPGDLLVFNNSRVINARLKFQKLTGGIIEIFCLEPVDAFCGYRHSLTASKTSVWKCLVGGISKWKSGAVTKDIAIQGRPLYLSAEIVEKLEDSWLIRFSWDNGQISFLEILENTGQVPLPPYIKRNAEESDMERYQTIFAKEQGSVAAPTAGLHFTPRVLKALANRGISRQELTLHVGAGTFKPVSTATMENHVMHSEWIEITESLINSLINTKGKIVAVGTTSLRSLESLFWVAYKIMTTGDFNAEAGIGQWEIYEEVTLTHKYSRIPMLKILIEWMKQKGITRLYTQTRILITPGYKFRVADALVTNFHQPRSTLLLLVAAATNNEWWRLYEYALANQFRFLSYGDSSLIFFDKAVMAES
ncbi:MAG: S-adenosylmethionine:tRNA ribosyltransferase-isomerase [Chitinophagaceae bacterium]|nr:S-adenosylmethionine:tRNA ribosyltransferase-isomerase [Bacteroidota bacterium]MCC6258381.1 S-adenosylmethionine:tRNA ribosyltransferase-isomerase [Chitinophagaceae bacterium]